MAESRDTVFGRLAVERAYITAEQLRDAVDARARARDEMGLDMPLAQVLVNKHLLTPDQAQELRNATAVETGEARLVAGYEVVSKLGQGGMGAVYKARRLDTGEYVALKILPPSLADAALIARFKREAEITSRLDHEHIVRCVEFGYDKRRKCHFCALELVEGENLLAYIRRAGALSEAEATAITEQVAMALQHAFYNGLVHRDVKPENVMVTPDGTAKLLDLGLARPANMEATRLTQSGMFVGSPYYASPEQALGEKDVDIRSDIYSLGATAYHMVTGNPPFDGTSVMQILQKHVNEMLPWPADLNPDLSDGFCLIVARMMAKSPADRYQAPTDLLRDLELLKQGGEPRIAEEALRRSSIAPAARPRRPRQRPPSAARLARARHSRPPSGPHEARPEEERPAAGPVTGPATGPAVGAAGGPEPSLVSRFRELPLWMKVSVGAGAAGVLAILLALIIGGKKAEGPGVPRPVEPGRGGGDAALEERSPADSLDRATRYAEANPDDPDGVYTLYEGIAHDFPGTPEAAEAKGRMERMLARAAGREAAPKASTDAASALRAAEAWEAANPANAPGAVARYEKVARDFPGTDEAMKAELRVIRLKASGTAGPPLAAEWRPIFDGRGMAGWRVSGKGARVEDGALVSEEEADLFFAADWSEFALAFEAKGTGATWIMGMGLCQTRMGRGNSRVRLVFHGDGDVHVYGGEGLLAKTGAGRIRLDDWMPVGLELTRDALRIRRGEELVATVDVSAAPVEPGGVHFCSLRGGTAAIRNVRARSLAGGAPAPGPASVPPGFRRKVLYREDFEMGTGGWHGEVTTDARSGSTVLRVPEDPGNRWFAVRTEKYMRPNIPATLQTRVAFRYRTQGAFSQVCAMHMVDPPGGVGCNFDLNLKPAAAWAAVDAPLAEYKPKVPEKLPLLEKGLAIRDLGFLAGKPGEKGACFIDDFEVYDLVPEAPAAAGDIDLTRGLVGWWKFDETAGATARDSSGKGNHGTLVGDPKRTAGRVGRALEFDGNDCVSVPASASLSDLSDTTLSGWFHVSRHSGVPNILAKDGNSAYRVRLVAFNPTDTFELILNDGRGFKSTFADPFERLADRTWHHVAVTVEFPSRRVAYYLDGSRLGGAKSTDATGIANTHGTLVLGAMDASGSEGFLGRLDDVRIYDRALSAGEVAALCREGERVAADETGRAKLGPLLTAFDALVDRRDFAGARALAVAESRKPENEPAAEALSAAVFVANILEKRQAAIRRSAEAHVGADVKLAVAKETLAGKVERVTGEGITLAIKERDRITRATVSVARTVRWSDLAPEDEDGFAGEWIPAGANDRVARAVVALGRKDADAASAALDAAPGHPLAAHYLAKIEEIRKAKAPARPAADADSDREDTRRGWPPSAGTMQKIFRGRVLRWDPKTLVVELLYDFEDPKQEEDWSPSTWGAWMASPPGSMQFADGRLRMLATNRCALLKGRYRSVLAEVDFAVESGQYVALIAAADANGNLYSVNAQPTGRAFLEKFVAGKIGNFPQAKSVPPATARSGKMSISFSPGKLKGTVGDAKLEAEDTSLDSGQVGFRAHDTRASYDNLHVTGQLDRAWLERELDLPVSRGLVGTYFGDTNLRRAVVRRVDLEVDFYWGTDAPAAGVPQDNFSVRWDGFIVPPVTGTYVFTIESDDGARMWIAGRPVAERWVAAMGTSSSGGVALEKGKSYPIRLEHMEGTNAASMRLLWTAPGTPAPAPVPSDCLRPPPGYQRAPGPPFVK